MCDSDVLEVLYVSVFIKIIIKPVLNMCIINITVYMYNI